MCRRHPAVVVGGPAFLFPALSRWLKITLSLLPQPQQLPSSPSGVGCVAADKEGEPTGSRIDYNVERVISSSSGFIGFLASRADPAESAYRVCFSTRLDIFARLYFIESSVRRCVCLRRGWISEHSAAFVLFLFSFFFFMIVFLSQLERRDCADRSR